MVPAQGAVPPEGQIELKLVAHLDDTLPFKDKLQLSILNSQTHFVPVGAIGKGTTIVTDRPFAPSLDLGSHFKYVVQWNESKIQISPKRSFYIFVE